MKKHFFIFIFIVFSFSGFAQNTTIVQLFDSLNNAQNDSIVFAINSRIETAIIDSINTGNNFDYNSNHLKQVGNILSDNSLLRILSWNYPLKNGNFGYSSIFIKRERAKINNKFKVYKASANNAIKPAENKNYSLKNWYGALYYKAFYIKKNYILLGYATYNNITKVKLIETIKFTKSNIIYGAPIFFNGKKTQRRFAFEYGVDNRMFIEYDIENKRFVFDNLSPSEISLEGLYQYYGPDFTYNSLIYKKKRWNLVKDLDVTNQ